MAYITTEVEVELSDFDLQDIIKELELRLKSKRASKYDKQEILDFAKQALGIPPVKIATLVNQSKLEFLLENIDNIKLEQLEALIKK